MSLKKIDGEWNFLCSLSAPDGRKDDVFGRRIAMTEDYLAITSEWDYGAVYIYSLKNEKILFLQKITPDSIPSEKLVHFYHFASTIAFCSDKLLVADPSYSEDRYDRYVWPESIHGKVFCFAPSDNGSYSFDSVVLHENASFEEKKGFGGVLHCSENFCIILSSGFFSIYDKDLNFIKRLNTGKLKKRPFGFAMTDNLLIYDNKIFSYGTFEDDMLFLNNIELYGDSLVMDKKLLLVYDYNACDNKDELLPLLKKAGEDPSSIAEVERNFKYINQGNVYIVRLADDGNYNIEACIARKTVKEKDREKVVFYDKLQETR